MIFQRLGILRNQRGFSLIEMIIVLAIVGFVVVGTNITIFQLIRGSSNSSNHMAAVRQVQNAGYWISRDAQMAQDLAPSMSSNGFPLTQSWTDRNG